MTFIEPIKSKSAAGAVAVRVSARQRSAVKSLAIVASLALLGLASSASALIISGGPSYTLPGGGSCTVAGIASQTGGATVSCSGVNLAAHTNVYFGIRNASNVNGNTMTGTAPAASSAAVFRYSSQTASSVTYTSSTTVGDAINGTQAVSNKLVLTLTAGAASVVATGGTPVNNGNGDIERLFKINSGTTFSVRADVRASNPFFAEGLACPAVYDPTQTPASGSSDFSKVDVAFYYSDCGDGMVDSPEQCDEGVNNGTLTSCCTSTCTYRSVGEVCRVGAGPPCDTNETCTGVSALCPSDDAIINAGTVCRTGSGDICDANETCTGMPGLGCPADDAAGNVGVVCRLSSVGDVCDLSETCTGVPGATCPADDAPGKLNLVCRTGSGDLCDPNEKCLGIPGTGCPADVVANPTTVCRTGSGDSCDPNELCTAVPGQPCPADVVQPGGTTCRPAANECDVAEQCSGTAGQACPANGFVAASTSCNVDNDLCTTDQCDGGGNCAFVETLDCDDGISCTQDSCAPLTGCEYDGTPSGLCTSASKSVLKYKDSTTDSKDSVGFLWKGGPALIGDMGDPTQTTRYELCIYDNTGVQLAVGVNPGAGWSTVGSPGDPKGYKYKDSSSLQNGVKILKTKASSLDKAKLKLVGKGTGIPDTGTLPFQFPITAQMYASDGSCWEAQFDQAHTKRNDAGSYKGKTP